ncbi:MAG: NAD(P)/FAD-dependent oxidoreductase [Lactobacillus sp.]
MKTIVVLGAGYAGLKTVVALQKKMRNEVKIILIDKNSYHYETMRLYEVASGSYPYTSMSYEIDDVLDKSMSELIIDKVERIDIENKKVELKNHEPIAYDYCVVGLGFTLRSMGIEGVEENALPMGNVKQAEAIRDHLENEMKAYAKDKDPIHLSIVICGGGFQATELAGALSEARPRLAKIAGVDPKKITIKMIEGSERLLPMFEGKVLKYALKLLKKHDIEVLHPAYVQKVTDHSVLYKTKDSDDRKEIAAGTRLWMMGISGSQVIENSGFKNRRGRVMVTDHLTAPESDDVYILGDTSQVMNPAKGWPWPNTAQMALSMANYAVDDIRSRINRQARPTKYVYHDLGEVLTVGESKAAGNALGHGYRGYLASALKKIIIDKSLMETGGIKETLATGRFDLYH